MRASLVVFFLFALFFENGLSASADCDHPIYCNFQILVAVEEAKVFVDSKTFTDMPLLRDASEVLTAFQALPNHSKETLTAWTNLYFDANFSDVDNVWTPPDWKPVPKILDTVVEPYRAFGLHLNEIWNDLGKETVTADIKMNPSRHSLLPLEYPFIAPGGRFREIYYWDSYWVIKGLLLCEMYDTTKGMLLNLVNMIRDHGHVLNGARIYYLNRSQPPLLTPMVDLYYEATKDVAFVKSVLPMLDKEYDYWMTDKKTLVIKGHTLNRFNAETINPRPEGFRLDYEGAVGLPSAEAKNNFWHQTATTAETGWDFSTRWMVNTSDISTLVTTTIAPVDLNAIMLVKERLLAKFHRLNNDEVKAKFYDDAAEKRSVAIQQVLFDVDSNEWYDYWTTTNSLNKVWYASNIVPLWAGETHYVKKAEYVQQLRDLLNFPGGIPSSLINSGQQWDFPSAWPPSNWFFIKGLEALGNKEATKKLVHTWVNTNYLSWNVTRDMFEKYNSSAAGRFGSGGEYEVQLGFGWTNGVVLDLLATYYQKGPETVYEDNSASSFNYIYCIFVVVLFLLR